MMRQLMFALLMVCSATVVVAVKPVELSRSIEAGGAVRIDLYYGRVRVVAGQPGQVRVTGEIGKELKRVTLGRDAGAVEVRARFPLWSHLRSFWRDDSLYRVDLMIEVPADTRLFLVSRDADIDIEGLTGPIGIGVVSSSVTVRGEPRSLNVDTVSGSFDFEGRTGSLIATSMSGSLSARGVDGSANLEAVTGDLALSDSALRNASLSTVSGDISVSAELASDGRLEIETDSGAVALDCCGSVGADLDLMTRNGEIINELSEEKPIRNERGQRVLKMGIGGGGGKAEVRTRSGLIRLIDDGT